MRARKVLQGLFICGLIAFIGVAIHHTTAQESALEQPVSNTGQRPEPLSDDATLNLHRWGAVTLFHGLPSDSVNAIAEDAQGILWFGTDNGLVRYDGRNVAAVPGQASLPSRRILALQLDARGDLWIGTEGGAARWRNERFEVLAETRGQTITGIAADARDELLLVTAQGALFHYRAANNDSVRSVDNSTQRLLVTKLDQAALPLLRSPNQPAANLPLTSATLTSAGVWLLGSDGRGLLTHRTDELRETTIKAPRPYFVTALYNDGARVWIGEGSGRRAGRLWTLKDETLTRVSFNTGAITALHGGADELWIGTDRQGAYLLDGRDGAARTLEHLTFENTAGGLRANRIQTIFRDREGVVWFGTGRGVCRYDRSSFRAAQVSAQRQSNFVRTLLASGNAIWCGANRGLFQLKAASDAGWTEAPALQGRAIYALTEDSAGAVWAATNNGLFSKPQTSTDFTRVPALPEAIIITDADNNAAADSENPTPKATPSAPLEATPPTQAATPGEGAPLDLQSQITNLKSPESVRALAIFRGQLFAAFYGRGIERIDTAPDGPTRTLVLSNAAAQHAICFAVEGEQALWFGTSDGAVHRYDGAQTTSIALPRQSSGQTIDRGVRALNFVRDQLWIGTAQGLFVRAGEQVRPVIADVDVRALLIHHDAAGKLVVWCATQNAGLIKLRPDENISIRFDTEQGLASQQVFALAANPAAQRDELWIGTNRGVVRHLPSNHAPRLIVNRLVADKTYTPDYLVAELSLPHTQRNFLLEVTGLGSKTFPSQFQYEFTIKGAAQNYLRQITTHDPQFAVENLATGPYLLTVRAISRDLIYSAPLDLHLRIRSAPFPRTTLLLASLLAAALIAAAWAFFQQLRLTITNRRLAATNIELRETRLRLANETEAERSRIARDLHDQTLADLRHLLVLTDQLPAPGNDDSAPNPAVLRREIEVISSEIRHICEDLSPSVLENIGFLPALEWALADAVAHLPTDEKFAYEFICEPELEERLRLSQIEQIQLYRIVQEVLNNICRHAQAKAVRLAVRAEHEDELVIEIDDDGVGFTGCAINRTGHGLANIRSRANLIGAQIAWHDTQPGCQFVVRKAAAITSEPPDQRTG